MWGGREGSESDAAKDVRLALDRYKEAVDICCAYARDRGYDIRFAIEPKPNEPRGNILLPTVGHTLAFVDRLEFPEMVGLNPEFAHETMSGLSFHHAVAQTLWSGKLFHIDLNGQIPGKYDQDFRFGSEGVRDAFYTVKLLEDANWDGTRHFDAHAYRTEDGRRRVGLRQGLHAQLPHPAREGPALPRGRGDPGRARGRDGGPARGSRRRRTAPAPTRSRRCAVGRTTSAALAAQGYGNERLDQLVTELLLGIR